MGRGDSPGRVYPNIDDLGWIGLELDPLVVVVLLLVLLL